VTKYQKIIQKTSRMHFMLFLNMFINYRNIRMAGAGAPFVTPMFWPAGYVLAAFSKSKDDKPNKVKTGFFRGSQVEIC
jgi:hypothetical protein